jgi:hypothetical protein
VKFDVVWERTSDGLSVGDKKDGKTGEGMEVMEVVETLVAVPVAVVVEVLGVLGISMIVAVTAALRCAGLKVTTVPMVGRVVEEEDVAAKSEG